MLRMALILYFGLLSGLSHADPLYQVDLIVFAHKTAATSGSAPALDHSGNTGSTIALSNAISDTQSPYHLLPPASSQLRNEYWSLSHKPDYQILAHYTWLQPGNNQRPVALPSMAQFGWNIEGTLRIRRSNYYLLDTNLLFTHDKGSFAFEKTQRLKPGAVYYLDHPQAGMLIKVHQV
jgi:hypothetical protein